MAQAIRSEGFTAPSGNPQPRYVGYAATGTATSVSMWRIARISYDSNDLVTAVEWPNGSHAFSFVWDDRTTYTYS